MGSRAGEEGRGGNPGKDPSKQGWTHSMDTDGLTGDCLYPDPGSSGTFGPEASKTRVSASGVALGHGPKNSCIVLGGGMWQGKRFRTTVSHFSTQMKIFSSLRMTLQNERCDSSANGASQGSETHARMTLRKRVVRQLCKRRRSRLQTWRCA